MYYLLDVLSVNVCLHTGRSLIFLSIHSAEEYMLGKPKNLVLSHAFHICLTRSRNMDLLSLAVWLDMFKAFIIGLHTVMVLYLVCLKKQNRSVGQSIPYGVACKAFQMLCTNGC